MARENGGNRKKYEEEIGYCKKSTNSGRVQHQTATFRLQIDEGVVNDKNSHHLSSAPECR